MAARWTTSASARSTRTPSSTATARRIPGASRPPGMLLDLIARWELDPARCAMVGDQPGDMNAAAAASVRGVWFDGGSLLEVVGPIVGV